MLSGWAEIKYNVHVALSKRPISRFECSAHRLRTPNEDINQRYLKNWADVADKICFGRT